MIKPVAPFVFRSIRGGCWSNIDPLRMIAPFPYETTDYDPVIGFRGTLSCKRQRRE